MIKNSFQSMGRIFKLNIYNTIIKNSCIKANKIILCARSVYFDQMFSNKNFIECDSGEVRFDCDKIIMERVIKYLYHGFEGIVEERVGEGIRYS